MPALEVNMLFGPIHVPELKFEFVLFPSYAFTSAMLRSKSIAFFSLLSLLFLIPATLVAH